MSRREDSLDLFALALLVLAGLIILGLFVALNVAAWRADDAVAVPAVLLIDACVFSIAGWTVLNR